MLYYAQMKNTMENLNEDEMLQISAGDALFKTEAMSKWLNKILENIFG